MDGVLEHAVQAGFAAAAVLAALSLGLAAAGRVPGRPLAWLGGLLLAGAASAWAGFAFDPDDRTVAIAAGGLTVAALAQAGAAALAWALSRARRTDEDVERVRASLTQVIDAEATTRTQELERTLALARADSVSLLQQEERRIAEERRIELTERERAGSDALAEVLAGVERRLEERLQGFTADLDRAQQALGAHLARLEQRQAHLIAEAETRIESEAAELIATADDQRATVLRLREELERTAREALSEALDELQQHALERRRAIEEVAERLGRRERSLAEQIERAEGEARGRVESAFADLERRQVEHAERLVARETARHAEAAAVQFEVAAKTSREEAARRLSRELDRAVVTVTRQADALFAERLNQIAEQGAQRLEGRLRQAQTGFERQRDEVVAAVTQRLADADVELRKTLGAIVAEAEAERSVLEARLHQLARRIDETASQAVVRGE